MKKILLPLIVSTILLFACNSENKPVIVETNPTPAYEPQKAKAFIDSINSKFSEAIKNGDSTWVASQYSPDAEILMEKSDLIKGKDILGMWGGVARSNTRDWTFTTTDLQGDENFLIETGTYEIKDAAKKLADRGKYVVVWKKQADGSWKLYRDIGASSPMPAK
jgi:ketosteroid isomerase-like protein